MRILIFVLFSSIFLMCKSKDVLPAESLISYVVILEGVSTPKVLEKDISYELIDYKKVNKTLNQWALRFKKDLKIEEMLLAELLNHPKVISLVKQDQSKKMDLKNGKKAKVGPIGGRNAAKQK